MIRPLLYCFTHYWKCMYTLYLLLNYLYELLWIKVIHN